jgi:hypothetical protein
LFATYLLFESTVATSSLVAADSLVVNSLWLLEEDRCTHLALYLVADHFDRWSPISWSPILELKGHFLAVVLVLWLA